MQVRAGIHLITPLYSRHSHNGLDELYMPELLTQEIDCYLLISSVSTSYNLLRENESHKDEF